MNKKSQFLLWTLIALVALVFYYSKGLYKVYHVSIIGDEDFKKNVERALGLSHVRYKVVKDSNIVFNGYDKTFTINGFTYHLDWPESVKDEALEGSGCDGDCKFVPIFNDKLDEDRFGIYLGCIDVMKGKGSNIFSKGWLSVKMAVVKNRRTILVYDPLTREKVFQNY